MSENAAFKLALRQHGNYWRAFIMQRDQPDHAPLEIGAISMQAVMADSDLRQAFMDLMQRTMERVFKDATGAEIKRWNAPEPAPESERAGNA